MFAVVNKELPAVPQRRLLCGAGGSPCSYLGRVMVAAPCGFAAAGGCAGPALGAVHRSGLGSVSRRCGRWAQRRGVCLCLGLPLCCWGSAECRAGAGGTLRRGLGLLSSVTERGAWAGWVCAEGSLCSGSGQKSHLARCPWVGVVCSQVWFVCGRSPVGFRLALCPGRVRVPCPGPC